MFLSCINIFNYVDIFIYSISNVDKQYLYLLGKIALTSEINEDSFTTGNTQYAIRKIE